MSPFLKGRAAYEPRFPTSLADLSQLTYQTAGLAEPKIAEDQKTILKSLFPKTYGQHVLIADGSAAGDTAKPMKIAVVLSGGQAPGGHNVICGIFEGLKQIHPDSELIGFRGGPGGILRNEPRPITPEDVKHYKNTGGFDMLGSGRTKIESAEQFATCKKVLVSGGFDGLVIIGGDDSNTNAALLAEYFLAEKTTIQVIGVPKTIDGDLKNEYVETSFGFDTAVRLYSELIANIARDTLSARKYYHFIRLMGRAASHITLEAALQTQPNIVLISEEVQEKKMGLFDIVEEISQTIIERANQSKNYGIVLVPEGLIEFVPEMKVLIDELNDVLAENATHMTTLRSFSEQSEYINHKLGKDASYTFSGLPTDIQRQLLMDRDPHGNVQVSRIETEKLLIEMISARMAELSSNGKYAGTFSYQHHFLGYEGRCAAPTNFDADYAYALGLNTAALLKTGVTGYMSVVKNLASGRPAWLPMGVPLTAMMNIEKRHGKDKPVIRKALVSLTGKAFKKLLGKRAGWALNDEYRFAGAIQYFGPAEIVDQIPQSLSLELGDATETEC